MKMTKKILKQVINEVINESNNYNILNSSDIKKLGTFKKKYSYALSIINSEIDWIYDVDQNLIKIENMFHNIHIIDGIYEIGDGFDIIINNVDKSTFIKIKKYANKLFTNVTFFTENLHGDNTITINTVSDYNDDIKKIIK